MKREIALAITEALRQALKKLGWDDLIAPASQKSGANKLNVTLDFSTDSRFGELSTNIALKLGRVLKKSPQELIPPLVSAVKDILGQMRLGAFIEEIKAEGAGFINFYFRHEYFYTYLKRLVQDKESTLKINLGSGRRVLLEFVSANPTGPLSVAHARQAAVGDALANILGFLGFRVQREYYLNDEGNQVEILGKSIQMRLRQIKGEKVQLPQDYYQGEYIKEMARQISEKNLKPRDFCEYGTKYILQIIKKELQDFGVKFDCWYSQKALRKSGKIKKTLDGLKKKGFLYEQDGALWFKSSLWGDDKDRVVVKSDGTYTYLAPDIAYHQDKYRRGFSWLINLWGPDHHGYINRLKAAVGALGEAPDSVSIVVVQLATILKAGEALQMSTRRGQYITLREVIDEVGKDAARFFFLMRRTLSHLDFDLEVAKKQTPENPVYYIQYAYARICSILRNYSGALAFVKVDLQLLKEEEEIRLLKKLWQFSSVLEICVVAVDPYMLTVYLQELSEAFHKFYDRYRVLSQDNNLTQARLVLVEATRVVIGKGLELLGVSCPQKM